jgi:hypothetical protein
MTIWTPVEELAWQLRVALREIDRLRAELEEYPRREALSGLLVLLARSVPRKRWCDGRHRETVSRDALCGLQREYVSSFSRDVLSIPYKEPEQWAGQ